MPSERPRRLEGTGPKTCFTAALTDPAIQKLANYAIIKTWKEKMAGNYRSTLKKNVEKQSYECESEARNSTR